MKLSPLTYTAPPEPLIWLLSINLQSVIVALSVCIFKAPPAPIPLAVLFTKVQLINWVLIDSMYAAGPSCSSFEKALTIFIFLNIIFDESLSTANNIVFPKALIVWPLPSITKSCLLVIKIRLFARSTPCVYT